MGQPLFYVDPSAISQSVQENLYGTNGPVNAIAVSGNIIFLGGSFTQIGRSLNAYFAGMSTTITSVAGEHSFTPREVALEQNYPNYQTVSA